MEAAKESNKEQKRVESVNEEFNHRPVIFRRCGMQTRKERLMAVTKKWKLFDREPPSLALILGAEHRGWIPIHTHTHTRERARGTRRRRMEAKKRSALSTRGGRGTRKGGCTPMVETRRRRWRWIERCEGRGEGAGLLSLCPQASDCAHA